VELLVAVTVIAALTALLLPALSAARQTALTVECASNLNQIGITANVYALDHEGNMPPYAERFYGEHSDVTLYDPQSEIEFHPEAYRRMYILSTWFKSGPWPAYPRDGDGYLGPYLSTVASGPEGIIGCPDEPIGPTIKSGTHPGAIPNPFLFVAFQATSYGVNIGQRHWMLGGGGMFGEVTVEHDSVVGRRLNDLPGYLVMMADGPGTEPYLHGPDGYNSWDDITSHAPELRHQDTFNAITVGGNVENGTVESLWTPEYWHHYD
jgi:hypothetical protein